MREGLRLHREVLASQEAGVSLRTQSSLKSKEARELGCCYSQVRQGGHVCKDALWEGGDVIAVEGPEERRSCWCLVQRQGQSPSGGAVPVLC